MLIKVGSVERIELGTLLAICACCALQTKHCTCKHDKTCWDTECPNRYSTF